MTGLTFSLASRKTAVSQTRLTASQPREAASFVIRCGGRARLSPMAPSSNDYLPIMPVATDTGWGDLPPCSNGRRYEIWRMAYRYAAVGAFQYESMNTT
jgi:hypothetical protein